MIELRTTKASLAEYLLEQVLPRYDHLDAGHGRSHVERVLQMAYLINDKLGERKVDEDILTTAVIYHDLGILAATEEGRAGHNERSAAAVREDVGLRQFFNEEEIEAIAMACYEHRASYGGQRESLLSKIVADADTMDSINFERIILYYEEIYAGESEEFIIEKMWQHYLKKQHPEHGYARYDLIEAEEIVGPRREFLWKMLVEEGGRERFEVVMKEKMAEMKATGKVSDDAKGWGSWLAYFDIFNEQKYRKTRWF